MDTFNRAVSQSCLRSHYYQTPIIIYFIENQGVQSWYILYVQICAQDNYSFAPLLYELLLLHIKHAAGVKLHLSPNTINFCYIVRFLDHLFLFKLMQSYRS